MKNTQAQLKELRSYGMSQREIADEVSKKAPTNQVTIGRWENGGAPDSLDVAAAIADLVKTTRRKWKLKTKGK